MAQNSVPPQLKPYAENQHPYHPFTGTGCTGLSDDAESVLKDHQAQPLIDSVASACNLATPDTDEFSEYSSIILQNVCTRGSASCAFQEAQALNVGARTLSELPTASIPTLDEDPFQDAEEDNL